MAIRNAELKLLLDRHGLRTQEHNNWILADGELPAIRASWFESSRKADSVVLEVLIQVLLPDERILEDCHAGIGATEDEAFRNGMLMFCTTTLHVLMAAFWGRIEPNHVVVENWNAHGRNWTAFIGNFGRRAGDGVDVPIPADFFPTVEAQAKAQALTGALHWISAYHAHFGNGNTSTSFLVDNQPSEPAQEAAARVEWPASHGFYSVRNFLILKAG